MLFVHTFFKIYFWQIPLFLFFNTQTIYSTQQQSYDFLKNLIPWRDSNPGFLFLSQCRQLHAAKGQFFKTSVGANLRVGAN
jgi:hypothetical protein